MAHRFKLILFDIDGTLIYHVGKRPWKDQYTYAAQKVFGVPAEFNPDEQNGRIERETAWEILKPFAIPREVFLQKFPDYIEAMHEFLEAEAVGDPLYHVIPEAKTLIEALIKQHGSTLGILTGNARRTAEWKLLHTKLSKYFSFGLYGDEADDRIELAGTVFGQAKKELGMDLKADEIVVIGDTMYDVRCGKAIGAYTIGVTTGLHGPHDSLTQAQPDLLVSSLTDKKVLDLFSL